MLQISFEFRKGIFFIRLIGDLNKETYQEEAKELEKIMVDAALILLPGTHYAYLENLPQVINILNNFF